MTTNNVKNRPIKISDKNYQELRKIKHKNMVESMDAALTIALGTHKEDTKKAKMTETEKKIKGKI